MNIAPFNAAQYNLLVTFIARHNPAGEHHIGYFGESESEIRVALDEFVHPLDESFLLAWESDELVGVFGVDYDPEIDRAWLFGPLVTTRHWPSVAEALYAAIQRLIPPTIHEQELFFDARNTNGQDFATRHAFPLHSDNAILSLNRADLRPVPYSQDSISAYQEAYFEQFQRLHTTLFPKAYFTARQIVAKLDDDHRLLLAIENDQVLGYHFCKREAESGYIDFIGVDASAQGKGLGASLLAMGLDWIFSHPPVGVVNLTVNAHNVTAIRLYEKFGFVTQRVMRGYRKRIS